MNYIYMSDRESKVFELLKAGYLAGEMAGILGWQSSSVYGIIGRLIQMQVIQRSKVGKQITYRPLIGEYVMVPDEQELFKIRRALLQNGEPFQEIHFTLEMEKLLVALYETTSRKKLSEIFGVPKYVINRELIRMGLERRE